MACTEKVKDCDTEINQYLRRPIIDRWLCIVYKVNLVFKESIQLIETGNLHMEVYA